MGGKDSLCEGIVLGEDVIINEIDIEVYKYLTIIEGGNISHNELKERNEKLYLSKLKYLFNQNLMKTIKTIKCDHHKVLSWNHKLDDWRPGTQW